MKQVFRNASLNRRLGTVALSLALVFLSACGTLKPTAENRADAAPCVRNDETGHPKLFAYEFPHSGVKVSEMPDFVVPLPREGIKVETGEGNTLVIRTPADVDPEAMSQEELDEVLPKLVPEYRLPEVRQDFDTGEGIFSPVSGIPEEEVRMFWIPGARRMFVNLETIQGKNPKKVDSPPLRLKRGAYVTAHFDEDGICTYTVSPNP